MKHFIIYGLAALFAYACSTEKGRTAGDRFAVTPKVVAPLFSEDLIFRSDTVYALQDKANKDQATKSRQLFMQALDQYINKKNPAASIPLFRASILYYPDLKTYNYLANAYIDVMDTLRADSAIITYDMGDYDTEYTLARLYAVKKDTLAAISTLASAFSNGFSNKKRFENDPVFDYMREHRGFTALVVTYLKNDARLLASLFRSFLAATPGLQFPFALPKDSLCETNLEALYRTTSISYDFAPFISGMEDSRFSRDVSNDYFLVGKLPLDQGRTAVFYKSVVVIADTLPPVEVKMAVFDSLGNLIEESTFAKFELPETLVLGSIDENRVVRIQEYRMRWKSDPLENGYAGNEYTGEELVSETRFTFGTDGRLAAQPAGDGSVAKH